MQVNVYVVRDIKGVFGLPTTAQNDAIAMRSFESQISQASNELFTHRSDFQLYRIGVYDMERAKIEPEDLPVLICEGKDVVG